MQRSTAPGLSTNHLPAIADRGGWSWLGTGVRRTVVDVWRNLISISTICRRFQHSVPQKKTPK
ncbi:hypothetical protein ACFL5F_05630, partial [Planctomycetota bacterium]